MEYKNIATAINAVMKEIDSVGKNTTVGKGNNSYKAVSESDIKKALRGSMAENGLSILQTGVDAQIKIDRWDEEAKHYNSDDTYMKSKQSVFTEVTTNYLLLHTSGESIPLAGYGQGVDTQDKGAGKATTYALKNTLMNTFMMIVGEDTENTHSDDLDVPNKKTYNKKVQEGIKDPMLSQLECKEWIDRFEQETDINALQQDWETFNKGSWSAKQIEWAKKVKDKIKDKLIK